MDTGWIAPLNGQRVVDVAETTLAAGKSMVAHWEGLEPIVGELTKRVRKYVEASGADMQPQEASKLLVTAASVVDKLAKAAQQMIRASEGQSRLAVLLSGGVPKRADPAAMSEKQLVGVVLEVAKRLKKESGTCPVCTGAAIEVEAASA